MLKGTVASLRELKAEIEALQDMLSRSQAAMQVDFQRWHVAALEAAKAGHHGRGAGGGGTGGSKQGSARQHGARMACRDRTNGPPGHGMAVVDLS